MNRPFPPGDRTYCVSDERLKVFGQLTPEQRLKWVEELAAFLRLAKLSQSVWKTGSEPVEKAE